MRFVCDHDVDARVAAFLRKRGQEAWTADDAGLSRAADDELAVYAHTQRAALISHDTEFSLRRSRNVAGQHIFLRCREWDAVDLLGEHLDHILPILHRKPDVWIRLSRDNRPQLSFEWQ